MYDVLSVTAKRGQRPAFSLAEILVTLTILGIVGAIFTRILLSQGRFADQQNALRGARMVSRQAMNVLEAEIRMVQDSGGIDSATTDGRTIRVLVPYRFGLNCGVSGGRSVVSMLPVDSLSLAQARYAGFAWRSHTGTYTTVFRASALDDPITAGDPAQCTGSGASQAQIRTLSLNGRAGAVLSVTSQPTAPKGQAVFFFQRITYTFKTSTAFPSQLGLFRTAQGGAIDEIMAPFDTTARFRYFRRGAGNTSFVSVAAPPALALIRGIDIEFAGQSGYIPIGKVSPSKSTVRASIFFRNVRY